MMMTLVIASSGMKFRIVLISSIISVFVTNFLMGAESGFWLSCDKLSELIAIWLVSDNRASPSIYAKDSLVYLSTRRNP